MKRFWIVALVMAFMLIGTQFAMAAGNQYISGSRDGEGFVGSDGHSFLYIRGTTDIIMEGATSDANEATIRIPDPASDIVYTMPATTGTLSLVGGAGGTLADGKIYIGNNSGGGTAVAADVSGFFTIVNTGATTGTLADGKIYIGNNVGGGAAVAVTPSGMWDITNAGVATGVLADGKIWIGNNVGGGDAVAVTMSGLTGITNAGVTAANANTIGTSAAFTNKVTLVVPFNATTNAVTVDSGHELMGFYLSTIGGINGLNLVNDPYYDGSGSWVISMVNALSADATWTFVFLSDN